MIYSNSKNNSNNYLNNKTINKNVYNLLFKNTLNAPF